MDITETPTPAQAYQEYFGPAIFEPLAARVLDRGRPATGDSVLDVACGTGIVTRGAARIAGPQGRALGIDINPAMIEVARSIAATGAPTEYRQGDATALDVPDESVDVCFCQQGLQFVADRAGAARELRRVVRKGGRSVIAVWRGPDHHPLYEALADAEEPHLADMGAALSREDLMAPFSFGDPDALRTLLLDAGFHRVDVAADVIEASFPDADRFVERLEFAYAAVVPAFVEDPAAFGRYLDAITAETKAVVDEYRQGDRVVIPMHTSIAVAS